MPISVLHREDIVQRVAASLHMPERERGAAPLISQALRRAAHILAPTSRSHLQASVHRSLVKMFGDGEALANELDAALELLLVYGEILEMRPLSDDLWQEAPLVLRPAPPCFIVRADSSIVIVGVAGDEITPLLGRLNERITFHRILRILTPEPGEDLPSQLLDLGLLELGQSQWLRLPPSESADGYVAKWRHDLDGKPIQGVIDGLTIVGPPGAGSFYASRRVSPSSNHTGMFVGRRPQKYGAPLWCLVRLEAGHPKRLMDLFSNGDRVRPCDIGWRIQMAIDAAAGMPQSFRVRHDASKSYLDFFSPIPSWAERKLAVAGERCRGHQSLVTYSLPRGRIDESIKFLRESLWLEPSGGGANHERNDRRDYR